MQPLNQPERRTRLWQFVLLYLLALAVPLGASYYLFSNTSLADENARLKQELDQSRQGARLLTARFDTLSHVLGRIDNANTRLSDNQSNEQRVRLTNFINDQLNTVAAVMGQLRVDSAGLTEAPDRRLVRDELHNMELFRTSYGTANALREQLSRSGDDKTEIARLTAELARTQQELSILRAMRPQQPAAPSGGGGGGGGGGSSSGSNVADKQRIVQLQGQLAMSGADCLRQRAAETKSRKDKQRLLEDSRTAYINILQNPQYADLRPGIEEALAPINKELGRPPRFFGLIKGGSD